ncbi:hypothetical protein [Jiangella rhizosphaerae]|uniref:HEAT repeat domain-containing protein n=1 Tax=Jiangella rhizosphaerae TaxID=2293569 RepID=A0A418KPG5_9ACTN|nr:hypothetical protein [Jiangella rhizosphaerae]RIQ21256.1 hypothetical protein DY240_15655 [Jiangella rhizosphaerae]
MNGEGALRKALMQADRGDLPGAEATLRRLLDGEASDVTRVRALVVLGDLLTGRGDPGARWVLTEALSLARELEDADDLLGFEFERAHLLLEELHAEP